MVLSTGPGASGQMFIARCVDGEGREEGQLSEEDPESDPKVAKKRRCFSELLIYSSYVGSRCLQLSYSTQNFGNMGHVVRSEFKRQSASSAKTSTSIRF